MFPHHKDWAVRRMLARLTSLTNDLCRGKLRGRTLEELRGRISFYGANVHLCLDRIDVRILNAKHQEDGTQFCNFAFKCLACGHHEIRVPDDRADDGMVVCPQCAGEIGTYGDLTKALSFLAADELEYGQPQKYLQQGADNEPAAIAGDGPLPAIKNEASVFSSGETENRSPI